MKKSVTDKWSEERWQHDREVSRLRARRSWYRIYDESNIIVRDVKKWSTAKKHILDHYGHYYEIIRKDPDQE